jgi:ABC-type transport system involved in cytochrome bd biosynthesis fused ATPase/permease subunit
VFIEILPITVVKTVLVVGMIVVEGDIVVVVVRGVVVARIVLLLNGVLVVCVVRLIVKRIIEFIEFDVRNAKTARRKKKIVDKLIQY